MFPLALLNASNSTTPETVLWLKFEGENGSTTFTDSSPYNAAFTRVGNPTIQDNSGAFFSSDYIKADQPVAGLYEWGDEDFEISGEFKLASIGGYQGIVGQRATGGGAFTMSLFVNSDHGSKLQFQVAKSSGGYATVRHQTVPSLNVLHSFKALRNGNYMELYLDNVKNDDDTYAFIGSDSIVPNITQIHVGVLGTSSTYPLNGYVKELKITKAASPPSPPVDYNTVLWLKFEGANGSTIFTDSSSQNNTITRYGSPSITTSNSKFGNSCLGINATSYLKINRSESFDIGAGQPFTIQMWLYITGGTGASGGLISMRDAPVYCPIEVNITNNGTLATKIGNATLNSWDSSSFTMSTYVWRHFAIVGDGSLIKVYNHGVQSAAFAQPHWPNDEYPLQINRNGDNQMQSCAYIDHLSFHKTALWLSDFTPPTSEFTY